MKYRIVRKSTHSHARYYIQGKSKWWPFWITDCDMWGCDKLYRTQKEAQERIDEYKSYREDVIPDSSET